MTDYKIASTLIEELKIIGEELLNLKENKIFDKLTLYEEFEEKLKELEPIMTRIRIRRNIKDENKQIYGEKMKKNIDVLLEKYDLLYTVYEEELTVFKENYKIKKQKEIEDRIEKENRKKEYEKELINRGRIITQMEDEEIQRKKKEKLKELEFQKKQKEKMELINNIIKEKCEFLYEEISHACNIEEVRKYISLQLGNEYYSLEELKNDENKSIETNEYNNELDDNINESKSIHLTNYKDLINCLYFIYKNNEYTVFKKGLKHILEYLQHLFSKLDDIQLKIINLMNKTFQQNILSTKGTLFIFILMGFSFKTTYEILPILKQINNEINMDNIYIYLQEPNLNENIDIWYKWNENFKNSIQIINTLYMRLHQFSDIPSDDKIKNIFLYLEYKKIN